MGNVSSHFGRSGERSNVQPRQMAVISGMGATEVSLKYDSQKLRITNHQ